MPPSLCQRENLSSGRCRITHGRSNSFLRDTRLAGFGGTKLLNELLCGGNKFILFAVRGGVAVQKNIGSIKEDAMQDGLHVIRIVELTPPTIEIVGFLGGAARFITKPCLKQRIMRFPTVRYGCSV